MIVLPTCSTVPAADAARAWTARLRPPRCARGPPALDLLPRCEAVELLSRCIGSVCGRLSRPADDDSQPVCRSPPIACTRRDERGRGDRQAGERRARRSLSAPGPVEEHLVEVDGPSLCRSGRTSYPGACMSTRKYVMPASLERARDRCAARSPRRCGCDVDTSSWPSITHRRCRRRECCRERPRRSREELASSVAEHAEDRPLASGRRAHVAGRRAHRGELRASTVAR